MTRVVAGCRIHCGLVDLGRATRRAYGGVGFMLGAPETVVTARPSSAWELNGVPLEERAAADVYTLLRRFETYSEQRAAISVTAIAPAHIGLGSKTALILSVAQAVVAELRLPLSIEDIQSLSGRGGASGVGIHGYFTGGFIVDAGHPREAVAELLPSSQRQPQRPPLKVTALSIPQDWRFDLYLPPGVTHQAAREANFFRDHTPLPRVEVLETLALMYHGVLPAVATGDLPLLAESLVALHTVGFKARELHDGQPPIVRECYSDLLGAGGANAATGMSSMGPLLYVVTHRDDSVTRAATAEVAARHGASALGGSLGQPLRNSH